MMDRTTTIAGGAIVVLSALWFASAPEEPTAESHAVPPIGEPAPLNLAGVPLRQIQVSPSQPAISAAFPSIGKGDEDAESGPILFTPEELTPQLSVKNSVKPDAKIELPSHAATPDPVVAPNLALKLAPVDPRYVESMPLSARPLQFSSDSIASLPPSVAVEPRRVPRLASAVERSNRMTAAGLRLAERGALFSARTEFLAAIGQIADAHDELQSTARHRRALNAAMTAIEESTDFDSSRATGPQGISLPTVVASHRSEVLKNADLADMNTAMARNAYLHFAVEQLALSVEKEPAASVPLFALGRVNEAIAKSEAGHGMSETNTAAVWYHAALLANSKNFSAAHELGTYYAQRGDWESAREVYRRAVSLRSHPTTWANLAAVHRKLGETDLAAAALAQAGPQTAPAPKGNLPPVEWVDPTTFAKTSSPNEAYLAQKTKSTETTPPATDTEPRSAAKPKSTSWFPFGAGQRR